MWYGTCLYLILKSWVKFIIIISLPLVHFRSVLFDFGFVFQVCKFFLDAIEKNIYGWFWNCPNGNKCIYRHALPPGFVLKKDKQKEEDEADKVTLEEHIENEVSYQKSCF